MQVDCHCSVQTAIAECIRHATGLGAAVSAFERAGGVTHPFITIQSLGDGTLSVYSGGSSDTGFSRVLCHACKPSDAMQLALDARAAARKCKGVLSMAGKVCVTNASHPVILLGPEPGQYVASFRLTHRTTRSD